MIVDCLLLSHNLSSKLLFFDCSSFTWDLWPHLSFSRGTWRMMSVCDVPTLGFLLSFTYQVRLVLCLPKLLCRWNHHKQLKREEYRCRLVEYTLRQTKSNPLLKLRSSSSCKESLAREACFNNNANKVGISEATRTAWRENFLKDSDCAFPDQERTAGKTGSESKATNEEDDVLFGIWSHRVYV